MKTAVNTVVKKGIGRPRKNIQAPRITLALNEGAATKLRNLQVQFTAKLGFEITASQLIEHLFYLHDDLKGKTK
jgi:hypothetical protein